MSFDKKLVTVEKDRDDEILGFNLGFVWPLTLISSFAITGYFQQVNFQGYNLVILNFELPSAFSYALCKLFEK